VEQFEQIRRDREREGLSIRALAARHGVHRRAVRQALVSAVPPAKRSPVSRPAPKLGVYRAIIDAWLIADREAPRKQRHTAKRIHQRLVDSGLQRPRTTAPAWEFWCGRDLYLDRRVRDEALRDRPVPTTSPS
jgi:hypothetical protein